MYPRRMFVISAPITVVIGGRDKILFEYESMLFKIIARYHFKYFSYFQVGILDMYVLRTCP